MDIRIKNTGNTTKVWGGQEFLPNDIYQLQNIDYNNFVNDTNLFLDIANGTALVGSLEDWQTDPIRGWEFLEHEGSNEVIVTQLPEPPPFAMPLYRTKRSATDSFVSVSPGTTANIDLKLLAERYANGGAIIVENPEFSDFMTAAIVDIDGVIPEAYRSSLCENWPIVATYIEKEFIKLTFPGSLHAGYCTHHEMNTYPLNAKITPGLYLRVTYTAVNSGITRRVCVNYFLSKKL